MTAISKRAFGDRRADHARIPDAGGRSGSVDVASAAHNGPAADEADAGGEPLDNVGAGRRVAARDGIGQQHVAAARHGHQRERAQPHAVLHLFAFPSDRAAPEDTPR